MNLHGQLTRTRLTAAVMAGLLALAATGCGDSDNAATEPTGTPDTAATETTTADAGPATDEDLARAAVADRWGRCLAAAAASPDFAADPRFEGLGDLSIDNTAVVTLDDETERVGVPVQAVVFPGGNVVFRVQLERGPLPPTATLPMVVVDGDLTEAVLDLGEAADPDCF